MKQEEFRDGGEEEVSSGGGEEEDGDEEVGEEGEKVHEEHHDGPSEKRKIGVIKRTSKPLPIFFFFSPFSLYPSNV